MKHLLLLVFVAGLFFAGCSDSNFEGVIEFRTQYVSKMPEMDEGYMASDLGTHSTTYIKSGYFLDESDARFMSVQLYRTDDNRLYFYHHNETDTLYSVSVDQAEVELLSHKIEDTEEEILGYQVKKLILEEPGNIRKTYWFAPDLAIDPGPFSKFKMNHYDFVTEKMGAVYLKFEMDTPQFTITNTAIKVERKELPEGTFDLPPHKVLREE